ncbi:helix-turn-helix transcriptional regulator [Nocardioides pakistanensis]
MTENQNPDIEMDNVVAFGGPAVAVDVAPADPIMTIDQAALYLGIPKATIYTWRTRRPGYGPRALKMGGLLRYRRSELDAFLDRRMEEVDDAGVPVPAEDDRRGRQPKSTEPVRQVRTRRSRPRR